LSSITLIPESGPISITFVKNIYNVVALFQRGVGIYICKLLNKASSKKVISGRIPKCLMRRS
jgi:hypothetical protein